MKKFFKKFKFLIISALVVPMIFIILGVVPTGYDLYVPATVDDIKEVYEFDNYDNSNVNVYSVSILCYYKISVLTLIEAKMNPFAVLDEHNDFVNTSINYQYSSGTIQKNVSLTNALIAGFKKSEKDINYKFHGDIIHSIYGQTQSPFKIGDIIIECEGYEIKEDLNVTQALVKKFGTKKQADGNYYVNLNLNDKYEFKVLRNREEVTIEASTFLYEVDNIKIPILGISTYPYYTVLSSSIKYHITAPSSFGPSAGLMQSLYIYDVLSNSSLTKNLKIVGTGTVDVNGNAGAIGGIKAKVVAAYLSGADIFFVPSANYEEALEMHDKLNIKMKLVEVKNLDDAINYLKKYQNGSIESRV